MGRNVTKISSMAIVAILVYAYTYALFDIIGHCYALTTFSFALLVLTIVFILISLVIIACTLYNDMF